VPTLKLDGFILLAVIQTPIAQDIRHNLAVLILQFRFDQQVGVNTLNRCQITCGDNGSAGFFVIMSINVGDDSTLTHGFQM
jgi:hypothetical protein